MTDPDGTTTVLRDEDVARLIDGLLEAFHDRRSKRLSSLQLRDLLRRKNPYLFRAKGVNTALGVIEPMLDAHLSSGEEGAFGDFLERFAIEVARLAFGGRKSSTTGIDLEFERDDTRYLVSIKSGPNWGNSSQVAKMKSDFNTAIRTIRQGKADSRIIAVNGCCYGRTAKNFDRGGYLKLAGRQFWELVSGEADFYLRFVRPLASRAMERNAVFARRRLETLVRLENEFESEFCDPHTLNVDWDRLVKFNSG